jgi:hypothetical protein
MCDLLESKAFRESHWAELWLGGKHDGTHLVRTRMHLLQQVAVLSWTWRARARHTLTQMESLNDK